MTFRTMSHNSGDADDELMTCCMCYVVYFFSFFSSIFAAVVEHYIMHYNGQVGTDR